MTTPDPETPQEVKVTFRPPLYEQRRLAILNILRKYDITEVLDVGCGEGELLAVLARAAPWLRPPSVETLVEGICASREATAPATSDAVDDAQAHDTPQIREPAAQVYRNGLAKVAQGHLQSRADDDVPSLRIKSLAGLDISAADLAFCVSATAPQPQPEPYVYDPDSLSKYQEGARMVDLSEIRWENLETKIWQGGLEVPNEEFAGMECITAMEVIEHLEPEIFSAFAPTILGVYQPKYLLVTTPSYTFNARFSAPPESESESDSQADAAPPPQPITNNTRAGGFLDPTGRTDRIFRHSDHKFEMTIDEFEQWCKSVAVEFGYDVRTWAIGTPMEKDPWGRDEECGRASQVAEFIRRDGNDAEKIRAESLKKYRSSQPSVGESEKHVLLSHTTHPAHPCAERPIPMHQITSLVYSHMLDMRETFMRVEELWLPNNHIAMACGGWVEWLTVAVDACGTVTTGADSPEGSVSQGEPGRFDAGMERLVLIRDSSMLLSPSFTEHRQGPDAPDTLTPASSNETTAKRSEWNIRLLTSRTRPTRPSWNPSAETSFDSIPEGWMPEEDSDALDFTHDESDVDERVARHGDSWDVIHEVEEESAEWGERTLTADQIAEGLERDVDGERDNRRDSALTVLASGSGQGWGEGGQSNPWSDGPDGEQGETKFDPDSYGHGWGSGVPGGAGPGQSPWGGHSDLSDDGGWGKGDADAVGKEEDWGKVDTPVLDTKLTLETKAPLPQEASASVFDHAGDESAVGAEKASIANAKS